MVNKLLIYILGIKFGSFDAFSMIVVKMIILMEDAIANVIYN
jgi:hypothetical protein